MWSHRTAEESHREAGGVTEQLKRVREKASGVTRSTGESHREAGGVTDQLERVREEASGSHKISWRVSQRLVESQNSWRESEKRQVESQDQRESFAEAGGVTEKLERVREEASGVTRSAGESRRGWWSPREAGERDRLLTEQLKRVREEAGGDATSAEESHRGS